MNKSDLVKKISEDFLSTSKNEMDEVVSIVFDTISQALENKKRVEIRRLGSFSLRQRKARNARNPKTNQMVELSDRFSVYFRASKNLNAKINNQN